MGRLPRAVDDALVYHALNRGNNRATVFTDDDDPDQFTRASSATYLPEPTS